MTTNMKGTVDGRDDYRMFINGKWCDVSDAVRCDVENPANEQVIFTVPSGTKADAQAALQSLHSRYTG